MVPIFFFCRCYSLASKYVSKKACIDWKCRSLASGQSSYYDGQPNHGSYDPLIKEPVHATFKLFETMYIYVSVEIVAVGTMYMGSITVLGFKST